MTYKLVSAAAVAGAVLGVGCASTRTAEYYTADDNRKLEELAVAIGSKPLQRPARYDTTLPQSVTPTGALTDAQINTVYTNPEQREQMKRWDKMIGLMGMIDSEGWLAHSNLSALRPAVEKDLTRADGVAPTATAAYFNALDGTMVTYTATSLGFVGDVRPSVFSYNVGQLEAVAGTGTAVPTVTTPTAEKLAVQERLSKGRTLAGKMRNTLQDAIAARYVGQRFGTELDGLLKMYTHLEAVTSGVDAWQMAPVALGHVGYKAADITKSFENEGDVIGVMQETRDARFNTTKKLLDSILDGEATGIGAVEARTVAPYLTFLVNNHVMSKNMAPDSVTKSGGVELSDFIVGYGPTRLWLGKPWTRHTRFDDSIPIQRLQLYVNGIHFGLQPEVSDLGGAYYDRALISTGVSAAQAAGAGALFASGVFNGGGSKSDGPSGPTGPKPAEDFGLLGGRGSPKQRRESYHRRNFRGRLR